MLPIPLPSVLQVGNLMLHINGESTQGLTHAQVLQRICARGPRLCRGPRWPPDKAEGLEGSQKQGATLSRDRVRDL